MLALEYCCRIRFSSFVYQHTGKCIVQTVTHHFCDYFVVCSSKYLEEDRELESMELLYVHCTH